MSFVRLKKRAEFLAVSKNRKSVFMPHFIFQYLEKPQQVYPRFGFTASKKVGNAVVRNRVKRRLREVVRLFLKNLSSTDFSHFSFDCVLVGRTSAARASFSDLLLHFDDVMNRLNKNTVSISDDLDHSSPSQKQDNSHHLKATLSSFQSVSQQQKEDAHSLTKNKKSSTPSNLCSP